MVGTAAISFFRNIELFFSSLLTNVSFNKICLSSIRERKRLRESGVSSLELQLGSSPVASLGIVFDFVAGSKTDPVGNGSILTQLLRQFAFDRRCLCRRHP